MTFDEWEAKIEDGGLNGSDVYDMYNDWKQEREVYIPRARPIPGANHKQSMLRVDGKLFRCECGCNVFSEYEPLKYVCNSCEALYTGEK